MKKIVMVILLSLVTITCSCKQSKSHDETFKGLNNYIGNIFAGGIVSHSQDEIYFMESHNARAGLYKSDVELKNKKLVIDKFCQNINMYDERIYYTDLDGVAYSMKKDGTSVTRLTDFKIDYMYLYNGRIYGLVANSNVVEKWKKCQYNLISLNTDGGDIKILCPKEVKRFYIYEGKLYYLYYDKGYNAAHGDVGYFRRMNLDGTKDELILKTDKLVVAFSVIADYIYYVCPPGMIMKHHIYDNIEEIVKRDGIKTNELFINLSGDFAVYQDLYGGFYSTNLFTGTEECIVDYSRNYTLCDIEQDVIYETGFYVIGDRVYFYDNGTLKYV